MADRLEVEERRLRAAIRSGATGEARAILRRIDAALKSSVAESPRKRGAPRPPEAGPSDGEAPRGNAWVRHTALARELGIDPRTLWASIEHQPFAHPMGDRIKLVHRARFFAELERGLDLEARR
jgi:hypothetical protein